MSWRRAGLAALALLSLAHCTRAPSRPTIVAESRVIAAVFETAQPYSHRTIEPRDLEMFFTTHPEYAPDSATIVGFYQRREMQFAWLLHDSLSASAETFLDLAGAGDSVAPPDGVRENLFGSLHDAAHVEEARTPPCDSCLTDLELQFTAEFYRFADRQYNGYLSRDLRDLDWFIPRAKKDPSRLLDSLAVGRMDLSSYEPIHPQYHRLKGALAAYRAIAAEPWPALAFPRKVRKLEPGDSATILGDIRHRLILLGDLQRDSTGERYDTAMVPAVKRFQARHGLNPDGVIGADFLRQVNVTPATRLQTMLINIERLRWVPERQPPDLILINIPDFRLTVFRGDTSVLTMKVVVGKQATHTVIFSGELSQIIFSPTWTVPQSITRNEILPALRKDPDYLRKHHMDVIGGTKDLPILRQRPGADNPLGGVKFLFPNSYDIYLHDTPTQGVFGSDRRALSHGCIRLNQPRSLAEYLLRDDTTWTPRRITRAMRAGKELSVPLATRLPVLITYFTAWVDDSGRVNFRDDLYGHDARLGRELFGP